MLVYMTECGVWWPCGVHYRDSSIRTDARLSQTSSGYLSFPQTGAACMQSLTLLSGTRLMTSNTELN